MARGIQTGLSRWQMLTLSAPVFAFATFEGSVTLFMPTFLSGHVGLSLGVVSVLLLIVRTWDTFNDPLMGAISDATPVSWARRIGRRKVWMIAGVPLVMAATLAVYFAPHGASVWQIGMGLFVLCTGWTLVNVPHGAWALEIAASPEERARVFGYRTIIGLMALPLLTVGPAVLEHINRSGTTNPLPLIGIMTLVVLPGAVWAAVIYAPEKLAVPVRLTFNRLWQGYILAFRQRDLWPLAALFAGVGAYNAIDSALYLFWVRHGLGLKDWGASLLLVQVLCGAIGIGLWLTVHKRLGTIQAMRLIALIQIVLALVIGVLPYGQLAPAFVVIVLRGLMAGAEFMLLRALLGQALDRHRARHGEDVGGAYYAGFHLLLNLAAALATFLALQALQATGLDPRHVIAIPVADAWRVKAVTVIGLLIPSCLILWLLFRRFDHDENRTTV